MTGFEPLIGAAAAGLGGLITNLVKDKGTETLKKLDWDIGKNLALRKAMVDYVRRYIDRHGTLKVACVRMDYPVRLDEIYTAVQLLDRSALRYFESEDALQEQYRESGKRSFSVTQAEKKPGLQVANEQRYLMVLGGPGVGKSTFLRKVGLEALKSLNPKFFPPPPPSLSRLRQGSQAAQTNETSKAIDSPVAANARYRHRCIPVMLELRQFDNPSRGIKALIAEELTTCGFPAAEELTELFLKNGKLLVLLDGLDEVPSATFDRAITEIENLVDRYSVNRYIASCRVAAYTFGGFTRFKDVAMAAFEDEQIEQFIKNWFQKERDSETNTAERCWKLLNSDDYQSAKELAQTPLLLALLCVVYDEFQDLPKKRHALYGEALDVLLRKWASEKRIQRNPIYQELSAELELDLLAEIAYTSFIENQLFFSKETLITQIRNFLIANLNAPSYLDAESVLREIEIQQGILVERARNIYSFSHLTFQEFLTAKFIVDNKKHLEAVQNHVSSRRWREVFLLSSGLTKGKEGGNEFLMVIEQESRSFINHKKLSSLIQWATKVTDQSPGVHSLAVKKIAAILLARDLVFAPSVDLTSARSLASCIDPSFTHRLNLILAKDFDLEFEQEFSNIYLEDNALLCDETNPGMLSDKVPSIGSLNNLLMHFIEEYQRLGIFNEGLFKVLTSNLSELNLPGKLTQDQENLNMAILMNPDKGKTNETASEVFKSCLINSLQLRFDLFALSRDEIEDFKDYFYILETMVRCKEAAVRVSPCLWAGIESRMVTVPD